MYNNAEECVKVWGCNVCAACGEFWYDCDCKEILTIDEALRILQRAKELIGGERALILSLTDSGIEDTTINKMEVIHEGEVNAYVEVQCKHPYLNELLMG